MKLIENKPFIQKDKRKRKGPFMSQFKPVPCRICGAAATRILVYQGDGYKTIEKYCDKHGGTSK